MTDTLELAGIVPVLDERLYHAHPALSSTGARMLLDSPARFRYENQPGRIRPTKDAWDLGTAVHTKVLGVGAQVTTYPPEHLTPSGNASTSKATVAWVEEQRKKGLVVISAADARKVDGMAEAVLAHPTARALFEQDGTAEASVFATDPETGVDMRARFDFLPSFANPNPKAVDLKTTGKSAHPEEFAKSVANWGYHIQQEWYRYAYELATGDTALPFEFVVVETAPPHLVGVYPLSLEYAEMGRRKVREALHIYAQCVETGEWPGYQSEYALQPPTWLVFMDGDIV